MKVRNDAYFCNSKFSLYISTHFTPCPKAYLFTKDPSRPSRPRGIRHRVTAGHSARGTGIVKYPVIDGQGARGMETRNADVNKGGGYVA